MVKGYQARLKLSIMNSVLMKQTVIFESILYCWSFKAILIKVSPLELTAYQKSTCTKPITNFFLKILEIMIKNKSFQKGK